MPTSCAFLKSVLLPFSFGVLTLASSSVAFADNFTVSYLNAGVQSSSASTYLETFDNATVVNGVLTTTFNNSPVTGTYTGSFSISNANVVGGAGGTGRFITTGSAYSLGISSTVNYFGLWFSALDAGNQLTFYNDSTLVYSFTPAAFAALVGACPSNSGFCGNPNPNQSGNTGQQYAFLNFFDTNGSFNRIVFTENPQIGGFESDNHTLGNLTSGPGGTVISGATPEPSSLLLLTTGTFGLAGIIRQRIVRG